VYKRLWLLLANFGQNLPPMGIALSMNQSHCFKTPWKCNINIDNNRRTTRLPTQLTCLPLTTTDLSSGDRSDPRYSQIQTDAEGADDPEDFCVVY
jgi:hypothetical protein